MTPKAQTAKAKINKWYAITLKSISIAKETINLLKLNLLNGRKHKRLISKLYQELL